MSHTDTLRAAYAAFKAGDLPGVLSALDEQIEWHVPTVLPQGGDYHGHDGVTAFFAHLAQVLEAPAVDVDAVLEQDDRVIVLGRVTAANADYRFAHSWQFTGDRASRFDEYADVAAGVHAAV
jgi:ketosteroid isomerase-like protein